VNDDKTQIVGAPGAPGSTLTGGPYSGPTMAYDPGRTQMAPPPSPGSFAPTPATGPVLTLTVRPDNRAAYASEKGRHHVLTQVTASGAAGSAAGGGPRMPVNVALVVDRSGSMEGEPLEYVKRACSYVVDMLTPADVLSIVTFEETVEVLMPARRVSDPNLIKQHIQRITPGNTTNLFDGLYAGGAQVASGAPGGLRQPRAAAHRRRALRRV
jgi:Ca-activated chloride channel family protein